jgi:hypothetical protein
VNECFICQSVEVKELLNLGEQPICNRFVTSAHEEDMRFPLALGQCAACGHVQLTSYPPAAALRPRYDWITYNEPQSHVGELVGAIEDLAGITRNSALCVVAFGNDLTGEHLNHRGFCNVWKFDLRKDLAISDRNAGVETLQAELTDIAAEKLARFRGRSDVLIVRHVMEHTHNGRKFLTALRRLVTPQGFVVLEVPDCEMQMTLGDCTMIWEEHVHYFTPTTLKQCIRLCGYEVVEFWRPRGSLVAITRPREANLSGPLCDFGGTSEAIELGNAYARSFPGYRQRTTEWLMRHRRGEGKAALFGAGHLGCVFVNLFGLKDEIAFVADDHPKKQGLFMPGSRLPIVGSEEIVRQRVKLCLSALSLDSEQKVAQRMFEYAETGGKIMSIFPGRGNSMLL